MTALPEGSLDKRNHWEKTSHALLVGAILHVLYAETDKTLAGVATFLSDPRRSIDQTLAVMMRTPHLGEAGPHPVVASAARELLNKSDNERSGVLSTAMTFLGLYRDPVVAAVTSRCDWRIADLVASPCSLYLVVPPSDVSRTRPLIRLILNQIIRRLTESLEGVAERQDLLLMLDELPVLGRLDFFESSLPFMAGYGIRAFLITRSLSRVGCRFVERDRYQRFVGRCWSDATPDINAALIRSGYATEYRRYSKGAYRAAEDEARKAGRGHWASSGR
jgi:type IV secretion system protein VirD4